MRNFKIKEEKPISRIAIQVLLTSLSSVFILSTSLPNSKQVLF